MKGPTQHTEIYVWGNDEFGQLGLGHRYHQESSRSLNQKIINNTTQQQEEERKLNIPKSCTFQTRIREIACGEDHSCLLTENGHVYSMGSNQFNKLGVKNLNANSILHKQGFDYSNTPKLVELLVNYEIIALSCGWNHSACITSSGLCFTWGQFEYGQLGHGMIAGKSARNNFNFGHQGGLLPTQLEFFEQNMIKIINVACGGKHTLFLSNHGNVYSSGLNDYGQLGIPTEQTKIEYQPKVVAGIGEEIVQIQTGIFHSLCLSKSGFVYSMGDNSFGQLGIGNAEIQFRSTPTRINYIHNVVKISSGHHSAALTKSGQLFFWGTGVFGSFYEPKGVIDSEIIDVSVGGCFGAALDRDGLVWTWGSNSKGELGVGDYEPRPYPYPVTHLKNKKVQKIQCGGAFAIAIGAYREETQNDSFYKNPIQQQRQLDAQNLDNSHLYAKQDPYQQDFNTESNIYDDVNNRHKYVSAGYELKDGPVNINIPNFERKARNASPGLNISSSQQQNNRSYNSHALNAINLSNNRNFYPAEKENTFMPLNEDQISKVIKNLQTKQLKKKRKSTSKSNNQSSSKCHGRKRSTSTGTRNNKDTSMVSEIKNNILTEQYRSNHALDKTVQHVLDKERDYLENQLLKEKKENLMKETIIDNLKKDLDNLANQLTQVVQMHQYQQNEKVEKKKKKKQTHQQVPPIQNLHNDSQEMFMKDQFIIQLQGQLKEERKNREDLEYLLGVKDQEIKNLNGQMDKIKEQQKSQLLEKDQTILQLSSEVQQIEAQLQKQDKIHSQLQQLNSKVEQENYVLKNQKEDYSSKFENLSQEMNSLKKLVTDLQDHQKQMAHGQVRQNESIMSFAHNNNNQNQLLGNTQQLLNQTDNQFFKTSLSNGTSPIKAQHDANSTVKDILTQKIKQSVMNSQMQRKNIRLDDSEISANVNLGVDRSESQDNSSRVNRFQRPERGQVEEIKDENMKLSEELLSKSANKLLQIMRTPNRQASPKTIPQDKEDKSKRNTLSPYSHKSQSQKRKQQLQKSDPKESKFSHSEQPESGNKHVSRLQNLSEMFQSTKLSQLFKKPAFYSSIRNNNNAKAIKENSAVKSPHGKENDNNSLEIFTVEDDTKARSQNYRLNKSNLTADNKNNNTPNTMHRKKESIQEFKAKLVRLERNKNDLENKMKEFEQKIRASNSRLGNSEN